jgi:hypothetical protein
MKLDSAFGLWFQKFLCEMLGRAGGNSSDFSNMCLAFVQCVEGKPILEFNRTRLLRSGLVGFCLHGSLSHHYYHVCEVRTQTSFS